MEDPVKFNPVKLHSNVIKLRLEVPTRNFSTWQSATLFSLTQSVYDPSDPDDLNLQQAMQIVSVSIPVDFLTISKIELDLNLKNANKKQFKQALLRHFQQCNAKVKSLNLPEEL